MMGNSSASKVKKTVVIPHTEELEKLFHVSDLLFIS